MLHNQLFQQKGSDNDNEVSDCVAKKNEIIIFQEHHNTDVV